MCAIIEKLLRGISKKNYLDDSILLTDRIRSPVKHSMFLGACEAARHLVEPLKYLREKHQASLFLRKTRRQACSEGENMDGKAGLGYVIMNLRNNTALDSERSGSR